ncbi:MAG: hypothetical protein KDC84_15710 [Crocinitomicaceae bacterium]|nr:hypothetical protein [Crocinitomicaceae bacterium]
MNRTIISLAIISTNWEQKRKDYIENFVPLIGAIINKKKYKEIDLPTLKKDFTEEYGLIIPSNPLQTIINRLVRNKYVKRNNLSFVPTNKISGFDLNIQSKKFQTEFLELIFDLIDYAKSEFNRDFNQVEIEEGIIAFFKKHDVDILFLSEFKTVLPEVKYDIKVNHLIGNYISHVYQNDFEKFKSIRKLSMGHALSSVILFDPMAQSAYSSKLRNVNFYLDTPFILGLIGFSGKAKEEACVELLDSLKSEGAKLFLLETNYEEVMTLLDDCYSRLVRGNFDIQYSSRTLKYCVRNNIRPSEVQSKLTLFTKELERHKIDRTEVPEHYGNRKYQIAEDKLFEKIVSIYSKHSIYSEEDISTRKEISILRDVKVISGISRFRKGNKAVSIKQAGEIFVTTNTALAFATREFEKEEYLSATNFIPSCITDVFLGTVLWMQSPAKVERLNLKKLMADCYSAIQPSERLIQKYLDEINRLKKEGRIDDESFILLKSHSTAIQILEEKTLGDPDEFKIEMAEEILDEITNRIKVEESKKLAAEKKDHDLTKDELENTRNEKKKQEDRIEQISNLIGKYISNFVLIVLISLLVVAVLVQLLGKVENPWSLPANVFIAALTLLNLVYGFFFMQYRENLREKISRSVKHFLTAK